MHQSASTGVFYSVMSAFSLRLFLLVCVATMLHADVCQAQDLRAGHPFSSFGATLRRHLEAKSEVPARSASHQVIEARQSGSSTSLLPVALPSGALPSRFIALGKHARFKARSALESAGV